MNNDLNEVNILLVEEFPSDAELYIRSRCVTYPPKVDDKEVLRRAKSDAHIRYIPVVVPTSSREDRDVAEGHPQVVNSFINKPVAYERYSWAVQDLGFYWLQINRTPI
jgi:hypothetical protein